jgi:hypothetical protein
LNFDSELHRIASAVLKPMPRMSRATRYGFFDMTCTVSSGGRVP